MVLFSGPAPSYVNPAAEQHDLPDTEKLVNAMNNPSFFQWTERPCDEFLFSSFRLTNAAFSSYSVQLQLNVLPLSMQGPDELKLVRAVAFAPESYRMIIVPNQVTVLASTDRGCYYGLAALKLLLSTGSGALPIGTIDSTPSFPNRGIMLDVSRGKIPTIEYLKELMSVLSDLKYNVVQLYCEDKLALSDHPMIGTLTGVFSEDEIRDLDQYCVQRFISLQPCIQTYSHMHGLLRLPGYSHLAENNDLFSFAAGNDAVYDFLDKEFAKVLPWFSCKTLNINMDEAYDIGTGYSKSAVDEAGTGPVFVNHINKVIRSARKHGAKTIQLWGDIVQKYADLIPELPEDVVFLEWNYNPLQEFSSLPLFKNTGREYWAAGGVGTWNGIFPRVYNSYVNLANLSSQAYSFDAKGFLVTDWGDYGHMQPLGLSLYGYIIGAIQADSAVFRSGEEFESLIWPLILRDDNLRNGFRALMDSNLAENLQTDFKTMSIYYFFDDLLDGLSMRGNDRYERLTEKTFQHLLSCGDRAVQAFSLVTTGCFPDANWDALFGQSYVRELLLSAEMTQFIGKKGILAYYIRSELKRDDLSADDIMKMILKVHRLYDDFCNIRHSFEEVWCLRARRQGIQTSLSLFDHAGVQLAQAVRWLASQREAILCGEKADSELSTYCGKDYRILWTADFNNMWDRAYPWR